MNADRGEERRRDLSYLKIHGITLFQSLLHQRDHSRSMYIEVLEVGNSISGHKRASHLSVKSDIEDISTIGSEM